MRAYVTLILANLWLCSMPLLANTSDWKSQGWEWVMEDRGISVYRKSVPGNPVTGVGGETLVDASIGRILWVLMDNEHKSEWVDKFQSTRTLETPSDLVNIQYAAFKMPFPVKDRDFIYRYDFSVDKEMNAVVVNLKSVEHPAAPASTTVGVRGQLIFGRYILQARGPNSTWVKAEYLADPKGILPSFVVNIVQRHWPYKTLMGLKKQVQKPFVKEWEVFEKRLKPELRNPT